MLRIKSWALCMLDKDSANQVTALTPEDVSVIVLCID